MSTRVVPTIDPRFVVVKTIPELDSCIDVHDVVSAGELIPFIPV